jgi:hypothetical protein
MRYQFWLHHADLERRIRSRPTIGIRTTVVSGPRAPAGDAITIETVSGKCLGEPELRRIRSQVDRNELGA